jgi:phosphoglycolate phosphatase-like HAD superfamily hydrolase
MDIRSGKAAGIYTIGVLTGYGTADSLTQAGADLIMQSAAEILKHIPQTLRP